ncbi:hypothetical protein C2G38_1740898 [Gigaspora rosea]|uniref:Uncharacterized protein n=1 Tax=Gigaspora rosea TaxID=44941 RepID=A0A397UVG5_9GLOM|nr:hypothetical protein C2G38_1740898 [Gigaspora rosea]
MNQTLVHINLKRFNLNQILVQVNLNNLDDEVFGCFKRVIVTLTAYPHLVKFLHFDIQSTGQKSGFYNTIF